MTEAANVLRYKGPVAVGLVYDVGMCNAEQLDGVILKQLAGGEMRMLVLLVSVRKALAGSIPIKVNLPRLVAAALRKLVAAKSISDTDGVYSIIE